MPALSGIYYTVHEGGIIDHPPVVLLHGAGGNGLSWPAEFRRLPGQRVLALDLPGHGKSDGCAQQTILAYADQVQAFLSELGLSEVTLVGHSMGGAVALTLALKYPNRVAALGLIASGANFQISPVLVEELSGPVTVAQGLDRLRQQAFSPSTRPAVVDASMRFLRQSRASLLLADWKACTRFDLRDYIEQIDAPAWVACGIDDAITPLAHSRYLATRMPAAQLQVVPGAGHMLPVEQTPLVVGGLSDFLTFRLPAIQQHCLDLRARFGTLEKQSVRRLQ